jgi:RiboL-PSP-HEPN
MSARDVFYERIGLLRELSNDSLLIDIFPPSAVHNMRATILRNGLVVSAFSLLESYLQDRIDENIAKMNTAQMGYAVLGEKLRRLLSLDAILGLGNRINFIDRSDRLTFAEANISKLTGNGASPIGYTGLGFSPKGSNISSDDLHNLLTAFEVQNPWQSLARIVSNMGATRVNLQNDFINLIRSRNKAAHETTTNTATADLRTHLDTALLVGMSIDILLTNAVGAFVKEQTLVAAASIANLPPLNCRFLDQDANDEWREKVGISGRTIKRYRDKSAAKTGALARAGDALVVVRDLRSIPIELL